jgi:hypothetical protein
MQGGTARRAGRAARGLLLGLAVLLSPGCSGSHQAGTSGLIATEARAWRIEAESPAARVSYRGGMIDIDTPAGLSLWYGREIEGPVAISFEAMAVAEDGPNDEVSDLNAFWMATDPTTPGGSVLAPGRSGAFATYDDLRTYYVGIGGNRNTTTRFRRYIGKPGNRPILPEHDLASAAAMLVPNQWTAVRLIADGNTIAVERDGRRLFTLQDPAPYTRGWFAIRTTKSHLRVRNLRITPL